MSTWAKLVGFVAALAAIFGLAFFVGGAVGQVGDVEPTDSHAGAGGHSSAADSVESESTSNLPSGLMVSQDGYTFALDEQAYPAGDDVPVTFTITGPDGAPVTAYDVEHEQQLHLIAVRSDFTGFQHVHPVLQPETGVWTTSLDLSAGTWRLFADFKATGADALTLGSDVSVGGVFEPATPTGESRTASVGDYEVVLAGDLVAGTAAELTLSITQNGSPVTDLEPYLGAYGHLVALRTGDLAYLHVHPDGTPDDGSTEPGPDVVFYADVPSAGTYYLYLDFQHAGVVHTAAFSVTTTDAAGSGDSGDVGSNGHGGADHD